MMLVNGVESSNLPGSDRGFNYGDGLFETMRLAQGRIVSLEKHLERLRLGCHGLRLEWPGEALLRSEISQVIGDQSSGVVKLVVTRGDGGRGYRPSAPGRHRRVIGLYPLPDYSLASYSDGVSVRVCETRLGRNPVLAGVKHLGRLEQVLASLEEGMGDADEGLMLDVDGFVTEGIRSNLFLVIAGKVVTPKLDQCGVAGVMRSVVIDELQRRDLALDVRQVKVEELLSAEELFLTNSIFGIWGVREIQGHNWSNNIGLLTKELMVLSPHAGSV
jgi:4-amino-4-deoxychorismate lyase